MGLGLPLNLLDFDEPFVAHPRLGPGGVDRPAEAVDVGGIHPAVGEIGFVRDCEKFVSGLALVHPFPENLGMP